jgi:hypothetical protein
MWLLASAVGVLILGRIAESMLDVYPFDSQLKVFLAFQDNHLFDFLLLEILGC